MRGRFGAALWALVCVVPAAAGVAGCTMTGAGRPIVAASASASPGSVPRVDTCHHSVTATTAYRVFVGGLKAVACTEPHVLETYHVGRFPAEVATRQSVPPPDGPEARAAFADCEAEAKDYLGGDWFTGRVYIVYTQVTSSEWDAGARHYRCDLAEVANVYAQKMVPRTGSLRDGLRNARPLASACYELVGEATLSDTKYEFDDMVPADCAGPHDTEFAGVFTAPGPTPPAGTDAQNKAGWEGCDKVVAAYLGGTPDGMRVTTVYWGYEPADWDRGDRRVRCYAAKPTKAKLKGSVKGIGNREPQTA